MLSFYIWQQSDRHTKYDKLVMIQSFEIWPDGHIAYLFPNVTIVFILLFFFFFPLVHSIQNECDVNPYPQYIPGSFPVPDLHCDQETVNQACLGAWALFWKVRIQEVGQANTCSQQSIHPPWEKGNRAKAHWVLEWLWRRVEWDLTAWNLPPGRKGCLGKAKPH